ncbi:dual oxidase 2-like [Ischnura elegans]|uniref:dual oxidase 2-like n=1 Tax=Ischnura elegans TaxID=197161 RepID=UPI001ED88E78|nr:dual oxidase 2-like [Ischnura elegans]
MASTHPAAMLCIIIAACTTSVVLADTTRGTSNPNLFLDSPHSSDSPPSYTTKPPSDSVLNSQPRFTSTFRPYTRPSIRRNPPSAPRNSSHSIGPSNTTLNSRRNSFSFPNSSSPSNSSEHTHSNSSSTANVTTASDERSSQANYTVKPQPEHWIAGVNPQKKKDLLRWLVDGCWGKYWTENKLGNTGRCSVADEKPPEYPGFDGWYNNIAHPELGAVDTPLLRHVPVSYEDGVYKPSGGKRPNPLDLSEALMEGNISSMSKTGRTAFMVFFGQQVVEEILDAQRPACPPEYFNIPIPKGHPYRLTAPRHSEMPFLRTRYDMRSGYSPNNPRQQLNEITPYIDGGLVYGTSKAWSDLLRREVDGSDWKLAPDGRLASTADGLFPAYNIKNQLPLANPPPPFYHDRFIENHETLPVSRFFKLGNPRGNENAFLLSFGILWFRWHNAIAAQIHDSMPSWDSERVFSEARKWVIATQQHIIVNDWLPQFLGEKLPKYEGYDPHVDPQIEQPFQSAAMRFGHTLVPKGVYLRDYGRNGCSNNLKGWKSSFVRTCNIYWRPQEPILSNYSSNEFMDIDRLLMGMALQLAEHEDNRIVEDLRGRVFGPLEFSRRDLMALNIQRARDHGLPDYNTIRQFYGLKKVTSFDFFIENTTIDEKIIPKMKKLYNNSLDDIDLWVGGLLETSNGPGELFRKIISNQFRRIRDGDRFWYANLNNGLFTKEEVRRIEKITIYDIVMTVTKMGLGDIQLNPFMAPENENELHSSCHDQLNNGQCWNVSSEKWRTCFYLPPIDDSLIEKCKQPQTYDYFWGSETAFAMTYTGLGIIIVGLITLLILMINWKEQLESKKQLKISGRVRESFSDLEANTPFSVEEWIGRKEPSRRVVLMLNSAKKQVQILSQKGSLLRFMDVAHSSHLEIFVVNGSPHIMLRVSHEYDLVVKFDSEFQRENFLQLLDIFADEIKISLQRVSIRLKAALHLAVTRADRQKRLEMFFRVVFSQAFNIDSSEEILNLDSTEAREVIYTELTVSEFADALSMKPESEFVYKMFALVDKDKNGYISFREFVDILIIFAKGTADEKAKLMFDMYDINGLGRLTREDFMNMIKSLMDTVNAELEEEQIQNVIYSMMLSAGLSDKEALDIEDFQKLLVDYKDNIGYAGLSFAGLPPQSQMPMQAQTRRMSSIEMAHMTIKSMYREDNETDISIKEPGADESTQEKPGHSPPLRVTTVNQTAKTCLPLKRFVEIHARIIFWTVLFTLTLLGIFAERFYYYSIEREHAGLRAITGYGVPVTRGAASAMMFAYSTILLTMCRNTITHLRETFLVEYIPFDSAIFLHKYIALWAFFFTALHILGHSFNFYHIATQTSDDLTCLFRNFFHATHQIPKFHYWCWETITGLTGVLLTVVVAIMGIFSVPLAREKLYSAFWMAHSLHPLLFILMILHGIGRLVQEPYFHYFFLVPCILFTLDRIVTFRRKKVEIPVLKAELLPSNVTMLEFKRPTNFEYRSGQWVRIACPAISESEFHPFTLSSAPHEPNLTVHIRAIGPWTVLLRQIYDPDILRTQHLPKIYLDGPYGAGHQDWYQFEVSVLIGGGIGVTPFASILKDIVFRSNVKLQTVCKKVYFLWITRTQKQFEWFVDIIKDLEAIDKTNTVSVHIFVTQFYHKFDLRTILLYICERHFQRVCSRSLFTGLMAVTHFGRPNFEEFFASLQELHSKTGTVGVFSCGSPLLTTAVDKACLLINKNTVTGPILRHHTKNF